MLVFNNIHFVHDDEAGHALLHMLQQRAESWAQAGVVTTVFASDNFGPYRHLSAFSFTLLFVTRREFRSGVVYDKVWYTDNMYEQGKTRRGCRCSLFEI